jgi:hypothetical protein
MRTKTRYPHHDVALRLWTTRSRKFVEGLAYSALEALGCNLRRGAAVAAIPKEAEANTVSLDER